MVMDIYASRDTQEDIEFLTHERLSEAFKRGKPNAVIGGNLRAALDWIRSEDLKSDAEAVLLLLGAGEVDNLREEIE